MEQFEKQSKSLGLECRIFCSGGLRLIFSNAFKFVLICFQKFSYPYASSADGPLASAEGLNISPILPMPQATSVAERVARMERRKSTFSLFDGYGPPARRQVKLKRQT